MPRVMARGADRIRKGLQHFFGHDAACPAAFCAGRDVFHDYEVAVAGHSDGTRF